MFETAWAQSHWKKERDSVKSDKRQKEEKQPMKIKRGTCISWQEASGPCDFVNSNSKATIEALALMRLNSHYNYIL